MGMKPRKKTEKKKNGAAHRGKYKDEMKILSVVAENPKRANTKAFAKFAAFKKGMTLGDYRKLVDQKFGPGEASAEINYSVGAGFIKVG